MRGNNIKEDNPLNAETLEAASVDAPPIATPRIHITFSQALYEQIVTIAKDQSLKPTDVIRQFIKMGLVAYEIQNTEGQRLIMQDGEDLIELRLIV